MKDALLLVDVVNDFRHEDGEALFHIASRAAAAARPGARASPWLDPRRVCERRLGSLGRQRAANGRGRDRARPRRRARGRDRAARHRALRAEAALLRLRLHVARDPARGSSRSSGSCSRAWRRRCASPRLRSPGDSSATGSRCSPAHARASTTGSSRSHSSTSATSSASTSNARPRQPRPCRSAPAPARGWPRSVS
jgi:hypothetical protein